MYSYSKLDTYSQCPFKYWLKYVEEKKVECGSVATEIGTAIHKCEEDIANMIINNTPIDYVSLKNSLIQTAYEIQARYPEDFMTKDKSDRTYWDKLYFYLEIGIYSLENFMKAHRTFEIVGVEKEFNFTYKDKEFHGFIDRVFHDTATGHYLIQDIKTYPIKVDSAKLSTPLQFVVYVKAAQELYNVSANKILCQYYLPFCDLAQNAGTSGFIAGGEQKMDSIFMSITLDNYTPNPNPLCNWCEYSCTNPQTAGKSEQWLCPYYSKWDRETRNKADIRKVDFDWQGIENHQTVFESFKKRMSI